MKSPTAPGPWFYIILLLYLVGSTQAWESSEYEMFDLVEEVGQNFYEVLEVQQDASSKDIKTAYRKLSLKLHPDKNSAPDAGEKFRQLVGIYEVLKDPDLRIAYNQVLRDGLPNWRHPSFYLRRVRKLELWQVGLIVLTIVSVCQYFGKYASYWEKKLSLQEQIDSKLRRVQRSRKLAKEGLTEQQLKAEAEKLLTKPSVFDLAPFQIYRGIKYTIFSLPGDIKNYIKEVKAAKEQERLRIAKELEEAQRARELAEEAKNKPRKRKVVNIPQKKAGDDNESAPDWGPKANENSRPNPSAPPVVSGGLWEDDDISELVRLCSKFPGGTPERWEKIAATLCRPVPEVTFMAKKVLERLANKNIEEESTNQPKVKVKTKGNTLENNLDSNKVENWSAEEQKALEAALLMYPKGSLERWDKIAKAVHGRSKEECMQRFKYLAEILRKTKEEKEKKLQEEEAKVNGVEEPKEEEEPEDQVDVQAVHDDGEDDDDTDDETGSEDEQTESDS